MQIDPIKSEVILCCVERCAGWLAKLTREKEKRAKWNGWPFQRHRPNRLLRITNFCQSHLKIAFFRFQTIQAKIQLQFYFHSYILRSSKLTSSSVTERRDRTNNAIILVINWTTFFYSFSFEWFVRVFWYEWVAIQKEHWTTLQFESAPNEQKLNDIYCNHVQYKKRRSKEWPFLCLSLSVFLLLFGCVSSFRTDSGTCLFPIWFFFWPFISYQASAFEAFFTWEHTNNTGCLQSHTQNISRIPDVYSVLCSA